MDRCLHKYGAMEGTYESLLLSPDWYDGIVYFTLCMFGPPGYRPWAAKSLGVCCLADKWSCR